MMSKLHTNHFLSFIASVLFGLIAIAYIGYRTKLECETQPNIIPPSPYRLQEMLNEYEPENPIKVDGKIGKETIEKWYRISNNIDAGRTFNP